MRTLYHLAISPFCRKVRVALIEKKLDFELKVEKLWERRAEFLALNPANDVPVLLEDDCSAIVGHSVIVEYLEEAYPEINLMGKTLADKAETRRLLVWFDNKFNHEVTENLIGEKVMRRILHLGEPHAPSIKAGKANVHYHLEYMSYLLENRNWLAGDSFSYADIVAASHLSALDYLGDVPWEQQHLVKEWYVKVKSRPSFRPILADRIPGTPPPAHYDNLDF